MNKRFQEHGFDTVLVAPGDTDVSLSERIKIANNQIPNGYGYPADFYLSIHANAWGNGTWNDIGGIETYILGPGGQAEKAAKIIHKHLLKGTQLRDRGIKTANFDVLRYTNMPAILFELAFMTNEREARLLMSDDYRHECAEEIVAGFCEYIGIEYKPAQKIPPEKPNEPYVNWKAKYEGLVQDLQNLIQKYS